LEISLEVTAAIAVVGTAVSIGVAWGIAQGKAVNIERYIQALEKDIWREVGKLRDWRHQHETDSGGYRMEIEKDIASWRSAHLAEEAERREHVERRFGDVNVTMAQILEQTKGMKEGIDSINRKVSRIEENHK
jgi:hypothetical protein